MNWIYPLYICEFLLFFLAFFLSRKDIMAPSVIMCVMFILSTTIAILAGDQVQICYSAESFGILIAGIFTFVLAEFIFRYCFQRKNMHKIKGGFSYLQQYQSFTAVHIQSWLLVVAIVIDVLILLWYLHDLLLIAGSFGRAVRAITVQTTASSWKDMLLNPFLTQLIKIVKALGYISGFVLIQRVLAKEKDIFQTVGLMILLVLGLIPGIVSASRGEILQFLSALIVYYNILWHQKNGWERSLVSKLIRIGVICIAVGIPLFAYSVVWMGRTSLKDMRTITETVNRYLGYPIYLFDMYVKDPSVPVVFGEESLSGVHTFMNKFFGMNIAVRNVNLEDRYFNGYSLGNVYTFFRRPLHDFGFLGMLIFTALIALFFAWIYYGKIKWHPRTMSTDCWSLVYGRLFYWILTSSIAQNSQTYISLNVLIQLMIIAVGYRLLNGIRITDTGLKYTRRRIPAGKKKRMAII